VVIFNFLILAIHGMAFRGPERPRMVFIQKGGGERHRNSNTPPQGRSLVDGACIGLHNVWLVGLDKHALRDGMITFNNEKMTTPTHTILAFFPWAQEHE